MKTAVQIVKTSQLYAQSFKNEMEVYSFEELEEDTVEFAKLKSIFDGYSKRVLMGVPNYQLTTNFSANCQLTTIFLANCQLTTNFSYLLTSIISQRY